MTAGGLFAAHTTPLRHRSRAQAAKRTLGKAYADAMAALDDLMTSKRRYWWQRLALWLR